MRGGALALALVLPLPAGAQSLPALFDVTGVAADDVLNVRAEGMADAALIGTLAPDAKGVEVVEENRGWGLVNAGEASGWVNMIYLTPQPGPEWFALQSPMRCLGTEPFWSLGLVPETGAAIYSTPEGGDRFVTLTGRWPGDARSGSAAVAVPDGFAVMSGGYCSDGMSDRAFGIRVDLFLTGEASTGEASRRLSGCCTLSP